MGCDLEVKVLSELGRRDRSEPQGMCPRGHTLNEAASERRGVTYRNRIEAGPSRASGPLTAKLSRSTLRLRKSGTRAADSHSSYSGRSRLTSERMTSTGSIGRRSEKSAEAILARGLRFAAPVVKGRTERRGDVAILGRVLQKPASAGLALEGRVKLESTAQRRHTRSARREPLPSGPLRSGNLNFPNRRIRTRTYGGVGGK